MVRVIPLKNGTMFKRLFSQPKVFQAFVEDVIGLKLNITEVHTEYEYPKPIGFVNTQYDLFAEDREQRVVVEIQHVKEENFFDRFLYYHIISLAEQVKNYDDYSYVRSVYTIVVLTSVPRDGSVKFSHAVSDMSPTDEWGDSVPVYPHRLVFLNPRNVNPATPPSVKAWLDLIGDSLDSQVDIAQHPRPLFQDLIEAMRDTSVDPEVLSEIKDDAAWERAKARFRREAREDGLEEGRKEGHKEGQKIATREIARQLLSVLDDQTISDKTGLSLHEVKQLRCETKSQQD